MRAWPVLPLSLALAGLAALPSRGLAQATMPNLGQLSLEDLMNIEVTSVSHKEQRVGDIAAAVYVITQEDIRRSGMTTVPELLRLVPGVQVARINSNKWAVAVRGFNNLFSDKLLVLIDGRTVYDRLNSGVFWESLDIPFDQIERIEVIRGPGGATWGANAVNGVINIITKSAADLPGGAVTVGGGTLDRAHIAARYGGSWGGVALRVYSKWSGYAESRLDATTPADDRWQHQSHGVRLDWTRGRDALMVQGAATLGKLRALWRRPSGPVPAVKAAWDDWSRTSEYNVLGRWTRRVVRGGSLQMQSFVNFRHNDDSADPRQTMADVEARYHAAVTGRHDVVVGGGYRFVNEDVPGGFSFSIAPQHFRETVLSVFAQDEIALAARLRLTLGAKVERDSQVGWGVQPTVRVMWTQQPHKRHLWAAVSRAVRTPSLSDLAARYNFTSFVGQGGLPVVVGALGNPAFQSETVLNTEAGYRREVGSTASFDVTAFHGRYRGLRTSEPLAPRIEALPAPQHLFVPAQFENLLDATAYGLEVIARLAPAPWWRVDAGYSTFDLTPRPLSSSQDAAAPEYDGNAPGSQWHARSAFSFPHGLEVDALVFHVAALTGRQIPAYTRADVRFAVPLTRRVSLSVVGQNLSEAVHTEYGGPRVPVDATRVPRSLSIGLVWRSR